MSDPAKQQLTPWVEEMLKDVPLVTEFIPGNVAPLRARIAELEAQLAKADAGNQRLCGELDHERQRTATEEHFKNVERTAHLATQRALCDAMDMIAKCDDGLLKGKLNDRYVTLSVVRNRVRNIWNVACAARAAVVRVDAPKPRTCGECRHFYLVGEDDSKCANDRTIMHVGCDCPICGSFRPRADAEKGGAK